MSPGAAAPWFSDAWTESALSEKSPRISMSGVIG
jgi:hypothetical protein